MIVPNISLAALATRPPVIPSALNSSFRPSKICGPVLSAWDPIFPKAGGRCADGRVRVESELLPLTNCLQTSLPKSLTPHGVGLCCLDTWALLCYSLVFIWFHPPTIPVTRRLAFFEEIWESGRTHKDLGVGLMCRQKTNAPIEPKRTTGRLTV